MKRASDFSVGEDVFIPGIVCAGKIEKVFPSHVVVRWEDGCSGVLDESPDVVCSLQRLRKAKPLVARGTK